jgi:hypothetical protein
MRPFVLEEIERIVLDPGVFTVRPAVLSEVIMSAEAKFASPLSRYRFAFRAALKVDGLVDGLFTREFMAGIPPDVLSEIIGEEEFAPLDGRLPFFAAVGRAVSETAALRTEAAAARAGIARFSEAIPVLRAEAERLENLTLRLRERSRAAEARMRKMQEAIESDAVRDIHVAFSPLRDKVLPSRSITNIREGLRRAEEETQTGNRLADHMKVMLPEKRAEWKRNLAEWTTELNKFSQCVASLVPTDDAAATVDSALFAASRIARTAAASLGTTQPS